MRVLDDYRCTACGAEAERFVTLGSRVECEGCGSVMDRLVSAPKFHLEPFSGDFPSATRKWETGQEHKVAKAEKHTLNHGE